jgi:hypothetical protein
MKKLALLSISILLVVAYSFAQTPTGSPENLNWKPVNPPSGIRADMPPVYLQGTFIELGIAEAGSCGITTTPAPAGYHPWYYGIGFIADFNMDGWAVGTPPYSGDYFLPGSPYEGWLLEYTYQATDYTFQNAQAVGYYDVPQTSLTNTSSGTTNSAVWVGTATGGGQSVKVSQAFHFSDTDAKFLIDVTLTNTGTEPLQDVEYARAVDPDQEQNITGDYTTSNYVGHEPDGTNNLAQVVGNGLVYGIPMGLQITHPNAKAHCNPEDFPGAGFGSLAIFSPDEPLDNTNAPTQGAPLVTDAGVSVAIRFPVLNPGQSASFTVIYVLNESEVINPPNNVPVSNWALALMVGLIVIFTVIRFRRMN